MNNNKDISKAPSPTPLWWTIFIIGLLEFIGFYYYTHIHITYYYPIYNDQASYLAMAYSQFLNIKKYGFFLGMEHTQNFGNGPLFIWQTAPWFSIFGASRFTALSLNLFYFLILQVTMVAVLWKYSKNWRPCLLAVALVLMLQTPFNTAGGLFDFRIDLMALSLYGISVTATLMSRIFLDRKWTIFAALIGGSLSLLRIITIVYLFAIFSILLLTWLTAYFFHSQQHKIIKARLKNLLLYQSVILLFISPFLWLNRQELYNYYVVGHWTGNEKNIRAIAAGVHNLITDIFYYPHNIVSTQLGITTSVIIIALLITGLALGIIYRHNIKSGPLANCFFDGTLYLFIALVAPIIVLTTDTSKSVVVAGITTIPLILLTTWIWLGVFLSTESQKISQYFGFSVIVILSFGLVHQFHHYHARIIATEKQRLATITKFYDQIGDYATQHNWQQINLSVDQTQDYLDANAFRVLYFERHDQLLNTNKKLGSNIFAITKQQALEELQQSNAAIFQVAGKQSFSYYPFDNTIAVNRPILLTYLKKHFKVLGSFRVDNKMFEIFVR